MGNMLFLCGNVLLLSSLCHRKDTAYQATVLVFNTNRTLAKGGLMVGVLISN